MAKEDKSIFEKAKDIFVNAINPKFKSYSKPLLLAATVGLLQLLFVLVLYSGMMLNTSENSATVNAADLEVFLNEAGPSCIHGKLGFLSLYWITGDDGDQTQHIRYSSCFLPSGDYPAPLYC